MFATRTERTLAFLVGLVAAESAFAVQVAAVIADGGLRVGHTSELQVAVVDDAGNPLPVPLLTPRGLDLLSEASELVPGVYRWRVRPTANAERVVLDITSAGVVTSVGLDIGGFPTSTLTMPARVDAVAGDDTVVLDIHAPDVPPEALQVVPGEGHLASVAREGERLRVTLVPDDSPWARVVPIALRDARSEAPPIWAAVRLRARPRIPLTAERGARVTLALGDRTYGPLTTDEDGKVDARIDQYPGESIVRARFEDDLGNTVSTTIPLATWEVPYVIGTVAGRRSRFGGHPVLHLAASEPNGRPVTSETPVCVNGDEVLVLQSATAGRWWSVLSDDPQGASRVACTLGERAATTVRVPVVDDAPARLRLRLWPDGVRALDPTTDVYVTLEDVQGNLLPPDAIDVTAARGTVEPLPADLLTWRGMWRGDGDLEHDTVRATWRTDAVGVVPAVLLLGWGQVPSSGTMVAGARVLDEAGRPVPDVSVVVDTPFGARTIASDRSGWAEAELAVPEGTGPFPLSARTRWRTASRLLLRGQEAVGGDREPDLEAEGVVKILPGRVAGVSVAVDPPVLRAGPTAQAVVTVRFEDPAGLPVTGLDVQVRADAGTVGPVREVAGGDYVASYTPPEDDVERRVRVEAEAEGLRTVGELLVQPRSIRTSFGPWVGGQTNLGALARPVFGFDTDIRTRLLDEAVMFGLGVYGWNYRVAGEDDAVVEGVALPLTTTVMIRHDRGPLGIWGGGGVAVAAHWLTVRFDDDISSSGVAALLGPSLRGGAGFRVDRGEVVVSVVATWLAGGPGDVTSQGNLAGVAAGVGYRLVY